MYICTYISEDLNNHIFCCGYPINFLHLTFFMVICILTLHVCVFQWPVALSWVTRKPNYLLVTENDMNTRCQNAYDHQKQLLSVQRQLGKQNIVQYRI